VEYPNDEYEVESKSCTDGGVLSALVFGSIWGALVALGTIHGGGTFAVSEFVRECWWLIALVMLSLWFARRWLVHHFRNHAYEYPKIHQPKQPNEAKTNLYGVPSINSAPRR